MRFNNMLEIFSVLIMTCGYHCNVSNTSSQTRWILSSPGYVFKPKDEQALFISQTLTDSRLQCICSCYSTINCRIFDYDSSSGRCRLFEGDVETMGKRVIDVTYQKSMIGYIKLESKLFDAYGQPCAACQQSRFLSCVNDTCQCPARTYFNGSICQSQKLLGSRCISPNECRQDLNYTCLPREQCGPESIQNGIVVAGYGNRTAGNQMNALNTPSDVDFDQNNRMYVVDTNNNRILRYEVGSNSGTVVAGDGIQGATNQQLTSPSAVLVDELSNMYVSDAGNHRVMLWLANSTSGRMIAGNGTAGSNLNQLFYPNGIRVDRMRNLYIADGLNHRIMYYRVNATSGIIVAGAGVPAYVNTHLFYPTDVHLDEQNKLIYVLDSGNYRVQRFPMNGSKVGITVAGGNGDGIGNNQFSRSSGFYISWKTEDIYIVDTSYHRIQLWRKGASYGETIAGRSNVSGISTSLLYYPACVHLNENETIMYICGSSKSSYIEVSINFIPFLTIHPSFDCISLLF